MRGLLFLTLAIAAPFGCNIFADLGLTSDGGTDQGSDADTDADGDADTDLVLDWVAIPGGSFQMGSDSGDSDEKPVHQVTVSGFELLRTEVTVAQYEACVAAGSCTGPSVEGSCAASIYGNWGAEGRTGHPANCVDWDQAVAFCDWIGGRLPTEAEWEYAARSGGQDIAYPWGDEIPDCTYAVMDDGGYGCGTGNTMDACSKAAGNSDQGLCDITGNVWEWVQDWYHTNYESAPTDGSAWDVPSGTFRVVRGGSFYSDVSYLRATFRNYDDPYAVDAAFGFRCAR